MSPGSLHFKTKWKKKLIRRSKFDYVYWEIQFYNQDEGDVLFLQSLASAQKICTETRSVVVPIWCPKLNSTLK